MTESLTARYRLLDAFLALIRRDGFAATSVARLCAAAGVSKGAFFHHFASKDDLAIAAAEHSGRTTGALFDAAYYRRLTDQLEQLLGYVALRRALLDGPIPQVTCLAGTMVQEAYVSAPAVRDAARDSILGHAEDVAHDIAAARNRYAPDADRDALDLSLHIQAVIQGAIILAKTTDRGAVAQQSIDHLKRYIEMLFSVGDHRPSGLVIKQLLQKERCHDDRRN